MARAAISHARSAQLAGSAVRTLGRVAPLAVVWLTTGCLTLGQGGVLAFDYHARDNLLGGDGPKTPVAVGGHVDLQVYARHAPPQSNPEVWQGLFGLDETPRSRRDFGLVDIQRTLSSIPEVARVDEPVGPRVRVHGISPGFTTITAESVGGSDTVVVEVAEAASATIDHFMADSILKDRFSSESAFLRGGTGRFFVSMRDVSGRTVVGAGVVPKITVEPSGAAQISPIADGDLRHGEVRFDRAGHFELRVLRLAPLHIDVIEPADVTALELAVLDPKAKTTDAPSAFTEGEEQGLSVRGALRDGRRVLLLGDVARITTSTPDVCATPDELNRLARWVLGDGVTAVRAVALGACTLVATLGTLRAETSIVVKPKPAPAEPKPAPPASTVQPASTASAAPAGPSAAPSPATSPPPPR